MSALCMYSCGRYTDEPDGICRNCKGFSIAKETIESLAVIPAKAGIQEAEKLDRPIKSDDDKKKNNGGEKMGSHKKCDKPECPKLAWRNGLCFKHYYQDHPDEKKYTAPGKISGGKVKKAKILPPPEVKVRKHIPPSPIEKGERGVLSQEGIKSTTSGKSSDEILKLVAQITAKRDALKYEIVKLDGALLTLHDLAGVDIPDPEFLRLE